MDRSKPTPVDRESRFELSELFFSTTDRKGRITSANDVFCRVAKIPLEEILNEPHNIIRHPEMPRAVFKLMWETILAGKSIAAYVKNMAADGSYYWVLATVSPIDDGETFLSIRMRPTSELFQVIREIYEELRTIELEHEARDDRSGGLQASTERLNVIVKEKGFDSYEDLMHTFVPMETALRDRTLGSTIRQRTECDEPTSAGELFELRRSCREVAQRLDEQAEKVEAFIEVSEKLDSKSRFVIELARSVRLASLNATAAASRAERAGIALGVIANAIGENAEESSQLAAAMEQTNARTVQSLRHAEFCASIARLQIEMLLGFLTVVMRQSSTEKNSDSSKTAHHGLVILSRALGSGVEAVHEAFRTTGQDLSPLEEQLSSLRRLVQALRTTHISGVIESHRMGGAANFLALFDQVGDNIETARIELREFAEVLKTTRQGIQELTSEEQSTLDCLTQVSTTTAALSI